MSIVLRIERLVVDESLAAGQGAAFRQSLERELARQLTGADPHPAWQRIGMLPSLPPTVCPPAGTRDGRLGSRVASAVVEQFRAAGSDATGARRGARHG